MLSFCNQWKLGCHTNEVLFEFDLINEHLRAAEILIERAV